MLPMTDREARAQLGRLKDWAEEKLQGGSEPPWAWYQYMKLVETARAMLQGFESTRTENLPLSEPRSGSALRLVASEGQQDNSQHVVVPLPM